MWTRREAVVGGALTLLFGGAHNCACAADPRAPGSFGCVLADVDFDAIYPRGTDTRAFISGDEPMIPKSGDADFDLALAQTLAKLSDALKILPGFAYYDDYDGLNAYATPRSRLARVDGTVLMGIKLLQRLRGGLEAPEVAVAAVAAHEFGHILQFQRGLIDKVNAGQPNVRRSELQADFFAGYFAGLRKRERPSFPAAVVAMTQFGFGDNNPASKSHHGTGQERGTAVVRGFEASFRDGKNLNDAIQESTSYVLGL
jgi:Putative neutral zinc metallopeptidase